MKKSILIGYRFAGVYICKKLHEQGRIPYRASCGFAFIDQNDNYRGIEWIDVSDGEVIFVKAAMRAQNFPVFLGEVFDELRFVLAYEALISYLKTGKGAVPAHVVEDHVRNYQGRYQSAGCHLGGTCVKISSR